MDLQRIFILSCLLIVTSWASLRATTTPTDNAITTNDRKLGQGKGKKSSFTDKPNIIFILADDLGYNSLSEEVSPFLTWMKNKGVNIPTYYSQELCTPARAALLTGRYPLSLGLQFGSVSESINTALNINETTIAEVLQDHGYTTYMFGKWHLGNASPRQLPTARGFDYYTGFLAGQTDYWSKRCPEHPQAKDFLYATSECYYSYDDDDLNHYSTFLYQQKAVEVIQNHNFTSSPMFLYMSFQAVHDPWTDLNVDGSVGSKFPNGIPESYFSDNNDTYTYIQSTYAGANVKQYFMALSLMDSAVSAIYDAVDQRSVIDNTYIIFASDNGGCPVSGGRNYPLRGGKSTLFEGGTRVEAFMYSKKLDSDRRGTEHSGLFHVTDWFPTILDLADISDYKATYDLDGFSQFQALTSGDASPREYVLYNFYSNIAGKQLDFFNNAGGAIRNSQYKLLHTYTNDNENWFTYDEVFTDDTLNADIELINTAETYNIFCAAPTATQFSMFLFDLENDPTEKYNLYDKNDEMIQIQADLWKQMQVYQKKSRQQIESTGNNMEVYTTWAYNDHYVTPWVKEEHLMLGHAQKDEIVLVDADGNKLRQYPGYCGSYASAKAEGTLVLSTSSMQKNYMLNRPSVLDKLNQHGKGAADPSSVIDRWTWSTNDIIVLSTLIVFVLVIITCTAMWFTRPLGKAVDGPVVGGSTVPQRGSTRPDTESLARMSVSRSIRGTPGMESLLSPMPPLSSAMAGRPSFKRGSKTTPPGSKRTSKRSSRNIEDLEHGLHTGMIDQPSIHSEAAFLLGDQQPPTVPVVVTQGDTALAQTLLSVLSHGMTMTVYNEKGAKAAHVTLEGGSILHWRTLKMFAKRNKNLNLRDVLFVNSGKQTNKFHLPTSRGAIEDNCFSLVTAKDTLDFEVSSKVERDALAQGFTILLTRFREQRTPEQVTWNPHSI